MSTQLGIHLRNVAIGLVATIVLGFIAHDLYTSYQSEQKEDNEVTETSPEQREYLVTCFDFQMIVYQGLSVGQPRSIYGGLSFTESGSGKRMQVVGHCLTREQ